MDDIIVYLIFVAFALLSRLLTKKKDPQSPPPVDRQDPGQERQTGRRVGRQPSFEELLREFTEGKAPEREPVPQASPYTSYEDEEYEVENYEEQYERDARAKDIYSRSVKEAKELKTIDELVDYDTIKTTLDSDKFNPYEQKKKNTLADEIRRQLQDPNEVRKAVIYSEILQRKY